MASAPLSKQLARTPDLFCQSEKGQSHQSMSRNREMGESQGKQELHVNKKEKGQSESVE